MAFGVAWAVTVNGRPATDRMNPYIESIECTDKADDSTDTALLVFDDTDGQCMLPPKSAPITITIEGVLVFEGFVDEPESVGARGSGMQLNVSCTSVDKRGKAKQRLGLHKDESTLEEFLSQAAKEAGLDSVKVDPTFAKIKSPYWSTDGRSFLQLGRELAAEFGATFKIRGKKAVFAKRGDGTAPGGGSLPTVSAIRGVNLISWRLSPNESRPRFGKARRRTYDRKAAKWEEEEVEIGASESAPDTADVDPAPRADKSAAKDAAGGRKTESEREGGSGDVTLLLDVTAFAEGTCVVSGVRAGIDGSYRIESRTHSLTRDGSETRLTLKQPQGEAGADSRAASDK
jgi:uncharacterized protein